MNLLSEKWGGMDRGLENSMDAGSWESTNFTFLEGGLCFDICMSFTHRIHKFSTSQGETTTMFLTIRANSPSFSAGFPTPSQWKITIMRPPHWKRAMLIKWNIWSKVPLLLLEACSPPPPQHKPVLSTVEQQGWNPISAGSLGWLGHEQEAFRHRPGPRWQRPPHSRWTHSHTDGGESVVGGFQTPVSGLAQWHRQLG